MKEKKKKVMVFQITQSNAPIGQVDANQCFDTKHQTTSRTALTCTRIQILNFCKLHIVNKPTYDRKNQNDDEQVTT